MGNKCKCNELTSFLYVDIGSFLVVVSQVVDKSHPIQNMALELLRSIDDKGLAEAFVKNRDSYENGQVDYLEHENEQLREALKKCSPFKAGYCKFCLNDILTEEHADDCEYILLTNDEPTT